MELFENELYMEDVAHTAELDLSWEKLKNSSVLISGAAGMIGSFLIDVLMFRNTRYQMNCRVYALGRNRKKAEKRFTVWLKEPEFEFIEHDINLPIADETAESIDFVLHLASNTHPVAYSSDPIGTITTNMIGTGNMLEFASKHGAQRCLFASSNEIYGENRGDTEKFTEEYCGYINCNTLRAGYPESKRCGETLCQAYIRQKGLDIVIARFTRTYGPTLLETDTKAMSQFLHKAVKGENIVLKSEGMQFYSFLYAADSVSGLLTVLLKGKTGEAYNISDEASDIRLRDLAGIIAGHAGKEVIFELPDEAESAGYSKVTKARLNSEKLQGLGWNAEYDIKTGSQRTIEILKALKA